MKKTFSLLLACLLLLALTAGCGTGKDPGKGVAFYSICTDLGETADAEDQAKRVLSDTGVTYPTLYPTAADTELGEFLMKIYAFPTTVLVNRNGEIIGNPIEGSINSDAGIKHLKDRIDKIVEADSKE